MYYIPWYIIYLNLNDALYKIFDIISLTIKMIDNSLKRAPDLFSYSGQSLPKTLKYCKLSSNLKV